MTATITLPQSIFKRLEKASIGSRRTPEAIVKQALKVHLDYEEWVTEQIEAGASEFAAGKGIPHDEFLRQVGLKKCKKSRLNGRLAQRATLKRFTPISLLKIE